jgi:lipopolysaccharide export system permease protein
MRRFGIGGKSGTRKISVEAGDSPRRRVETRRLAAKQHPDIAKAACVRFCLSVTIGGFMKLIDRYIGGQILVAALFGVGVLSFVLVLGNVFKQLLDLLVNHDVPIEYILSFVAYLLPFSLTFTIPWGFLTAVLLVFGKLSAENEFVAFKSNGVSITRICVPLFYLALICVGICLWIDLEVAPRAQAKMKNALCDLATNDPLAMFGSDHIIDEFPDKKIYVEKKDGTELRNILVYEMDSDQNPVRVVFARKGELTTNLKDKEVLLHIHDARFEQRDPDNPADLNKIREGIVMRDSVFSISLKQLFEKNKNRRSVQQTPFDELLSEEKAEKAQGDSFASKLKQNAIRTEINKRFSFSLASFALALMGVPLAITTHRKETSIGFLLSIVVAFGYFFCTNLVNMVQNNPKMHPELLIWLPNLVFTLFGSFLFWRLSRK